MTKQKIILTPTEVELAKRLGISPAQYAQQRAGLAKTGTWPMPEDPEFDDPNKEDVMNIPIKTVKDLWLAKFGYRWVSYDELDQESMDSWSRMEGRLQEYNLLENYDNWYKMKEDL